MITNAILRRAMREIEKRKATVGRDHPTVKFMLDNVPVADGELRVQSTDLFGLDIEEAVVFRAMKPAPGSRPSNKRMEPTRR